MVAQERMRKVGNYLHMIMVINVLLKIIKIKSFKPWQKRR